MELTRKIDSRLLEWRNSAERLPLVVRGASQVGKTHSIRKFAKGNYASFLEIDLSRFEDPGAIFARGYDCPSIINRLSLFFPMTRFPEGKTLIFFDNVEKYPDALTSLKGFAEDGRYDLVVSGNLAGVNQKRIRLNSVGYKDTLTMESLSFEEFLLSRGYGSSHVESMFEHMVEGKPFDEAEMRVYTSLFMDYLIVGGMPRIVSRHIDSGNFDGVLPMQRRILSDYEEDITKYALGLDKGKVLSVYRNVATFLGKENKKFRPSEIKKGSKNREYVGVFEWLENAGIVSLAHNLTHLETPLSVNADPNEYKVYFRDTGLLLATLDEESGKEFRVRGNLGTIKGGLFENAAAEAFAKQGLPLYYHQRNDSRLEVDFLVRSGDGIVPVEIKSSTGHIRSTRELLKHRDRFPFAVKFGALNVGESDGLYSFPHFTMFLLRRFLEAKSNL